MFRVTETPASETERASIPRRFAKIRIIPDKRGQPGRHADLSGIKISVCTHLCTLSHARTHTCTRALVRTHARTNTAAIRKCDPSARSQLVPGRDVLTTRINTATSGNVFAVIDECARCAERTSDPSEQRRGCEEKRNRKVITEKDVREADSSVVSAVIKRRG